jgi:hypothetical protein
MIDFPYRELKKKVFPAQQTRVKARACMGMS